VISQLKLLIQHSAIYGFSNILNKALAIILIPLYTHYLQVAEYGKLELFFVTLNFLVLFLPLGLNTAIFAFTISHEKNDPWQVVSTTLNFSVLFSGIFCLTIYLFSPKISYLISKNLQATLFLRIVTADAFFSSLRLIPLARLRAENKSVTYAVLNTAKFALNLFMNIYFVVFLKKGVEGILLAGLYSSIISFIFSAYIIRVDLVLFKISWKLLKPMLNFGVPLVPAAVANAILIMSNRFFLEKLAAAEELGLFTLGFKIATAISLLTMAFQTAWPTFLFSIAQTKDAENIYKKFLTYFLFILLFVFLIISILAKDIVRLLSPSEFHSAYRVVPLIVLSYIFCGVYYMTSVGVNIKRKTKYVPLVVGLSALSNLIFNFVLIPPLGMMGAAYALAISCLLLAVLSTKLSLYYYPIRYEYGRLAKLTFATLGLYMLSTQIKIQSPIYSLMLKSLLISSYPFLLYVLKFYQKKEADNLKHLISSSLKRKLMVPKIEDEII